MYEWDDTAGEWVDNGLDFSISDGIEQLSGPSDIESDFVDYSGYANLTGPELAQLAKEVETNEGLAGMSKSGLQSIFSKIPDTLKTLFAAPGGGYDWTKIAALGAGLYGASKPNNAAPTGYQGKIPKYTATRNMLTAPPEGRRPGSGGIDYGGGVTFKTPAGEVVSSNERTLEELRQAAAGQPVVAAAKGGLVSDGFVVPADVVSHLGNGSSEAGLKLLASKFGAEPIKGEGDGMSDSIPTKIDGVQEARVANEEAFISPEMVERIGNGDSEKGAKKLYAMMDRIRKDRTGTTKQGKQIEPSKYMPGGSVDRYEVGGTTKIPTGATGAESSLSNWAGDYVTDMLGRGSALAQAPYQAYTGPLTAGASPLQTQAFDQLSAYQTPASIAQAAATAGGIAAQAPDAGKYTAVGSDFGVPEAERYMNPYLESAIRPQLAELQRAADIARLADATRLTQAGAFGGSRQGIMESEGRRNLLGRQSDVLSQGYATAYDKAMQQFNADQARKIQEQQFGTTTGLEGLRTGIQAAQTQGQLGGLEAQTDLARMNALLGAGGVQRGIESEGIAADKAQFEEARLNPFKMLQFEQSLLSGLPLAAQSYTMPGTSNLQQFSDATTMLYKLLGIVNGTPPATTPKTTG